MRHGPLPSRRCSFPRTKRRAVLCGTFPALKVAVRPYLFSPHFSVLLVGNTKRFPDSNNGTSMMRTRTLVVLGLLLVMPSAAMAEERATDAALGAVSGAVVLGPIGAVAGALVGFTAGPSISRSWGLHRSGSQGQARRTSSQDAHASSNGLQPVQGSQTPPPQAAATPAAPARAASTAKASVTPPVQTLE